MLPGDIQFSPGGLSRNNFTEHYSVGTPRLAASRLCYVASKLHVNYVNMIGICVSLAILYFIYTQGS